MAQLAARTGHRFVRINNHEQTDLQEYLGSYVSDEQVRLAWHLPNTAVLDNFSFPWILCCPTSVCSRERTFWGRPLSQTANVQFDHDGHPRAPQP